MRRRLVLCLASMVLSGAALAAGQGAAHAPEPGEPGGPGLAIRCAKALVCPPDPRAPQHVDNALVLVKDGKIERVVRQFGNEVPAGYEVVDGGKLWAVPGMVELHCHEGGTYDINDMVYLTNPGLSSRSAVIPGNLKLERGMAAGVTSLLFIPGSGTNIGGQGVLFKAGVDKYEEALLRDPGSLKLAQWGNPESWTIGVGMAFENWNTRNTFRRGVAYAKRWKAYQDGQGPEPERLIQWEVFRKLLADRVQISTHTQVYQVVLMTLTMVKGEFGLPVFLDHSTIGGWLAGALAQEMGVNAICGPRSVDVPTRGMIEWAHHGFEGFRGVAAGYQERGLENVGFNTDSPVIPQESLPLQAGVGVRYGFDDSRAQAVRGLTVVPAMTVGMEKRIGNLSPGTDADIVLMTGHPGDPRSAVSAVWINGRKRYDAEEGRLY